MEPNKVVTIRPIKSNKAPVNNARWISCARNDAHHRELGTCITHSARKDSDDGFRGGKWEFEGEIVVAAL